MKPGLVSGFVVAGSEQAGHQRPLWVTRETKVRGTTESDNVNPHGYTFSLSRTVRKGPLQSTKIVSRFMSRRTAAKMFSRYNREHPEKVDVRKTAAVERHCR